MDAGSVRGREDAIDPPARADDEAHPAFHMAFELTCRRCRLRGGFMPNPGNRKPERGEKDKPQASHSRNMHDPSPFLSPKLMAGHIL
jgi:hypothetical protein